MRFTDVSLRALKPKEKRFEVWEDGRPGFGLRVTPKARKTFVYMYRFDGRVRRLTLGRFPRVSLAQAHLAHAQAQARLELGTDPAKETREAKLARRTALTFADLCRDFVERKLKYSRPVTWRADLRTLEREAMSIWGTRKAEDITRRDVIALIDAKVEQLRATHPQSRLVAANRLLWLLKRVFEFAVEREIVSASPCAIVRPVAKERQRDRVLSEDEIDRFLATLQTASVSEEVRLALRLALVTGQRRGEVSRARQSEFDLVGATWSIPGERTKNGRAHTVPLSTLALDIVKQALTLAPDSEWLFPSPVAALGCIEPHALSTAVIRMQRDMAIPRFGVHDLRRTAASHMTSLGFPRVVVAKILNHSDQGAIAVYDRYAYSKEKRSALAAWAHKLTQIQLGRRSNAVVAFRTR